MRPLLKLGHLVFALVFVDLEVPAHLQKFPHSTQFVLESPALPFGARRSPVLNYVSSSFLLLFGGKDGNSCLSDAWKSGNSGSTWEQVPATSQPRPSGASTAPVAVDGAGCLWLLGGECNDKVDGFWKTCDAGAIWAQVVRPTVVPLAGALPAFPAAFSGHAIAVVGDWQLVIVDAASASNGGVWRFVDREALYVQKVAIAPLPFGQRRNPHLLPTSSGALFLLGGDLCNDFACTNARAFNDIWKSLDVGSSWSGQTAHYTPGSIFTGLLIHTSVAIAQDDTMFLVGGTMVNSTTTYSTVYYSRLAAADTIFQSSPHLWVASSGHSYTLCFSEGVQLGVGTIEILDLGSDNDLGGSGSAADTSLTISVNISQQTLLLTADQPQSVFRHQIIVPQGSVKDLAGNALLTNITYSFFPDDLGPIVQYGDPTGGQVAPWSNIMLAMNEVVFAGNGSLLARPAVGEEIRLDVTSVTADKKVFFELPAGKFFTEGQEYTLVVPHGLLRDSHNNEMDAGVVGTFIVFSGYYSTHDYQGSDGTIALAAPTSSMTSAAPLLVSTHPQSGATDVPVAFGTSLILYYSAPIKLHSDGVVRFRNAAGDLVVSTSWTSGETTPGAVSVTSSYNAVRVSVPLFQSGMTEPLLKRGGLVIVEIPSGTIRSLSDVALADVSVNFTCLAGHIDSLPPYVMVSEATTMPTTQANYSMLGVGYCDPYVWLDQSGTSSFDECYELAKNDVRCNERFSYQPSSRKCLCDSVVVHSRACGGNDDYWAYYQIHTQALSRSIPVCSDSYIVSNVHSQSGQLHRDGVFWKVGTVHDKHPLYKNADNEYLFYWSPSQDWKIGGDYSTAGAGITSNNARYGCPETFDDWSYAANSGWNSDPISVQPQALVCPAGNSANGGLCNCVGAPGWNATWTAFCFEGKCYGRTTDARCSGNAAGNTIMLGDGTWCFGESRDTNCAIDVTAQACFHTGPLSNVGYNFGDIGGHIAGVSSARDCQILCEQHTECGVFQYEASTQQCQLKCELGVNCASSNNGATAATNLASGVTSGPKTCQEGATNIARGKPTTSSSVGFSGDPSKLTDGQTNNGIYVDSMNGVCAHTQETSSWMKVDLQNSYNIGSVALVGRQDCCPEQSNGLTIRIGNSGSDSDAICASMVDAAGGDVTTIPCVGSGRYISVWSSTWIVLCELYAYEWGEAATCDWDVQGRNSDCGAGTSTKISDIGTGVELHDCKTACESMPGCTDITWGPTTFHCVLFDGCENAYSSTGWMHFASSCGQASPAEEMVPYISYNSKACEDNSDRVFHLIGPSATENRCKARCLALSTCIAFSGKWNDWCIGCSGEMTLANSATLGALAFRKAVYSNSAQFDFHFSEPIQAAFGDLVLTRPSVNGSLRFSALGSAVSINGSKLSLVVPNGTISGNGEYALRLLTGSAQDIERKFSGRKEPTGGNVLVQEHIAILNVDIDRDGPVLEVGSTLPFLDTSPLSNSTSPSSLGLLLSFNEAIQAHVGDIVLTPVGQSPIVRLPASSALLSGDRAFLSPPASLMPGERYHLSIEAGAFADVYSNHFQGLTQSYFISTTAEVFFEQLGSSQFVSGSTPTGQRSESGIAVDDLNTVYVVGGLDGSNGNLNDLWKFGTQLPIDCASAWQPRGSCSSSVCFTNAGKRILGYATAEKKVWRARSSNGLQCIGGGLNQIGETLETRTEECPCPLCVTAPEDPLPVHMDNVTVASYSFVEVGSTHPLQCQLPYNATGHFLCAVSNDLFGAFQRPYPQCRPLSCVSPPDVTTVAQFAQFDVQASTSGADCAALGDDAHMEHGGTCAIKCAPGWFAEESFRCEFGVFNGSVVCAKQSCPAISVDHGIVRCDDNMSILAQMGDSCNVICNAGFQAQTTRVLCQTEANATPQANPTISPTPLCNPSPCGEFPSEYLQDGNSTIATIDYIGTSKVLGDNAVATCAQGFYPTQHTGLNLRCNSLSSLLGDSQVEWQSNVSGEAAGPPCIEEGYVSVVRYVVKQALLCDLDLPVSVTMQDLCSNESFYNETALALAESLRYINADVPDGNVRDVTYSHCSSSRRLLLESQVATHGRRMALSRLEYFVHGASRAITRAIQKTLEIPGALASFAESFHHNLERRTGVGLIPKQGSWMLEVVENQAQVQFLKELLPTTTVTTNTTTTTPLVTPSTDDSGSPNILPMILAVSFVSVIFIGVLYLRIRRLIAEDAAAYAKAVDDAQREEDLRVYRENEKKVKEVGEKSANRRRRNLAGQADKSRPLTGEMDSSRPLTGQAYSSDDPMPLISESR